MNKAIDRAAHILRILRCDYGKNSEKYRLITAWLNHYERNTVENSDMWNCSCGQDNFLADDHCVACGEPLLPQFHRKIL